MARSYVLHEVEPLPGHHSTVSLGTCDLPDGVQRLQVAGQSIGDQNSFAILWEDGSRDGKPVASIQLDAVRSKAYAVAAVERRLPTDVVGTHILSNLFLDAAMLRRRSPSIPIRLDQNTANSAVSRAHDIGPSGAIVGELSGRATLWCVAADSTNVTSETLLDLGGFRSVATGVNGWEQVCGCSFTVDGRMHAYWWQRNPFSDKGGDAFDITPNAFEACAAGIATQVDLDPYPWIAGYSRRPGGEFQPTTSFIYYSASVGLYSASVGLIALAPEHETAAYAINSQHDAIGVSRGEATLWSVDNRGQVTALRLADTVVNADGWFLQEARDITDKGLIAGNGLRTIRDGGGIRQVQRGFLLTPTQPAAITAHLDYSQQMRNDIAAAQGAVPYQEGARSSDVKR